MQWARHIIPNNTQEWTKCQEASETIFYSNIMFPLSYQHVPKYVNEQKYTRICGMYTLCWNLNANYIITSLNLSPIFIIAVIIRQLLHSRSSLCYNRTHVIPISIWFNLFTSYISKTKVFKTTVCLLRFHHPRAKSLHFTFIFKSTDMTDSLT